MPQQADMFGQPRPLTTSVRDVRRKVANLLQETPTLANDDWALVVAFWQHHCRLDHFLGPEATARFLQFVSRPDVPSFDTIVRRRREMRHTHPATHQVEAYRLRKGRQR